MSWCGPLSSGIDSLSPGMGPLRLKRASRPRWTPRPVVISIRPEMGPIVPDWALLVPRWAKFRTKNGGQFRTW